MEVGARQAEVLRRVLERNPAATTERLILQATPAGRGLTEADLAGLAPEEIPDRELLRVATSAIADKLVSKGLPPEREPAGRPKLKRGYVLAGDPLAASPIRTELINRGRRPGGSRSRAWVLAGPFDRLLAHAWMAACFDSGPQPWPQWLATWAHRDRPPTRADLITIAGKHRDAGRRPTIVTDFDQLPAALGESGPLPGPITVSAPAAEVARRVAVILGGLVSTDERRALLRTQLLPRIEGAAGPELSLPAQFRPYAESQAQRIAEHFATEGYPVLGSLKTLSELRALGDQGESVAEGVGPDDPAPAAPNEADVLDAALSMLASRAPVVPSRYRAEAITPPAEENH